MIDLLNRIGFRQIAFGGEGGGGGGAGRNMVTAPKTRLVQKQPHLLAYITPAEASLLKENGGTGEMVDGIPAFRPVKGKTSRGKSSAGSGFSGGSSSTKSAPAPRNDRQPVAKSTPAPAPAPRDRDDRQPTPTPTPKPATRGIVVPTSPPAAEVQALADSKAEAEAQALKSTPKPATRSIVVPNSNADSKAKAAADKAKADAEDLAMAQAVLPKVGPNPKMTTIKDAADARAKELADRAKANGNVLDPNIGTLDPSSFSVDTNEGMYVSADRPFTYASDPLLFDDKAAAEEHAKLWMTGKVVEYPKR